LTPFSEKISRGHYRHDYVKIQSEKGIDLMEAVKAYYDGQVFVPLKPVRAKKNQEAIVTILEDMRDERSGEEARKAAKKLYGIFAGTSMSTEAFMEQKQLDIELEG